MNTRRYQLAATAGATALILGVVAVSEAGAQEQERVRWKMQSAFPGNLAHLGTSGVRFEKNIAKARSRDSLQALSKLTEVS